MCRTGDCFHILVHFIESLLLDSTKNVAFWTTGSVVCTTMNTNVIWVLDQGD
jgi:hypothetical protein